MTAKQRRNSHKQRNKIDLIDNSTHKPDTMLLVIILFLSLFGAVMVYSGSVLVAIRQGLKPEHYFVRQLIWVFVGFILGFVMYKINYKSLPKLAPYALAGCIVLLIAVLLVNIDNPIRRWFIIGPFSFQPSEFTKLAFLIYLSSWLSKPIVEANASFKEHLNKELIPFLVMLMIVSVLIIIEPDLDTTVILGATSFIIYFIAGNDWIHFAGSLSIFTLLSTMVAISTKFAGYRIERFNNWLHFVKTQTIADPTGAGYQLQQILIAVSSGGLFGVGFGESVQKFHYLGETAFSDTIFAIFAEEFGYIGCLILIGLFFIIFIKGVQIARSAPDKLGFLLALSITIWITLQAFLHIASNVALIPINGNTLPFLSYGGSSTLANLAACGLLLNISKYSTNKDYSFNKSPVANKPRRLR